ncbi:Nif11-like leader peptide family natural product precursor [bacterium]|nr:Nif11-like leader peptide family natural product precursor [bacterium]
MSEEQIKAFWEAIQSDQALQQKLQGVNDPGAIVDIAKEAGFTISAEELQSAQVELSDEQLDGAAGGRQYCNCCV